MSYLLPHLESGWAVDQAILNEEDKVVVIRFGQDHDTDCMVQDEVLARISEKVKNFARGAPGSGVSAPRDRGAPRGETRQPAPVVRR